MGNKANAKDWHQEQKQATADAEDLQDEAEKLRYAANKRKTGYPHSEIFHKMGHADVGTLIDQAYRLLAEAEHLYRNKTGG